MKVHSENLEKQPLGLEGWRRERVYEGRKERSDAEGLDGGEGVCLPDSVDQGEASALQDVGDELDGSPQARKKLRISMSKVQKPVP